ncbi:hypothetical protein DNTS_014788, partial [Danionella cerebrum]
MIWFIISALLLFVVVSRSFPDFLKDVKYMYRMVRVIFLTTNYVKSKPFYTVLDRFLESVQKNPDKVFVRFRDESYSYAQADKQSNKIAWSLSKHAKLHEGDTVALLLGNEPLYLWIWLALAKLGCTAALLNHNIRSKSLLHCFSCCGASALIAGAEQNISIFILTDHVTAEGLVSLTDKVQEASDEPVPGDLRANVSLSSPVAYIYTSGTTGLPKAAVVTQRRLWAMAFFPSICGVKSDDILYICLPLYHSAAFGIGFGGAVERGAAIVLRSKFSSSQFWSDCRKYNVTVIQYIGETMRYLCNVPNSTSDQVHNVRMAIGNGIRPEVWRTFIKRFGPIDIKEFYGATEGTLGFLNYTGRIGAVGKKLYPYFFIKFDCEREEPVRNTKGFCEAGLLVAKISKLLPFTGYARDPKQTEKKKLYDVFEKGDVYFNSGDLFKTDADNFIYFHDRVGDTFRWKGENVSTNEVSDIMTMAPSVEEANVYGVTVPGYEGRVGMASLILKNSHQFESEDIFTHVTSYLPSYARPRFIRIQKCLALTGTFKQLKGKLVEEGFDPSVITEPLFVLDEALKTYRPLSHDTYESILHGQFRFLLAGLALLPPLLKTFFPYLFQDCVYMYRAIICGIRLIVYKRRTPFYSIVDCFVEAVKKHPRKAFIHFEGKTFSYEEVEKASNRVAHALRSVAGLTEGDTVALFLPNEPRFVWTWLGLAKLGCPAALLNFNIRSKSLLHCFSCCGARVLIAAAELREAVEEILPALKEKGITVYLLSDEDSTDGLQSIGQVIAEASDAPLSPSLRANVHIRSTALYIYTSGTTGLPKAAYVTHERVWASSFIQGVCGVTSEDIFYINLPLYHSAGFLIGLVGCIERGNTFVLRRKFSASQFWEDCRKHNITVMQYIGETLRYLCNTPKRDDDREHQVKIAIGNGVRADVWKEFLKRFGKIHVRELYAATEGNVGFINYTDKVGVVGRVNIVSKVFFPFSIIKFDIEKEEPVRNAEGFCIPVERDEVGLLVGRITKHTPFVGYAGNKQQTEKKRLCDVFAKGDLYFNSGDLLRIDCENFVYFQDRVGDTFRWKGENVATTEVADILSMVECVEEANVYGVKVEG